MQSENEILELLRGRDERISTAIACRAVLRTFPNLILDRILRQAPSRQDAKDANFEQMALDLPGVETVPERPESKIAISSKSDEVTRLGWTMYFVYMSCGFSNFQSSFAQVSMRDQLQDISTSAIGGALEHSLAALVDRNLRVGFTRHRTDGRSDILPDLHQVIRTSLVGSSQNNAAREIFSDIELSNSLGSATELGQAPLLSSPDTETLKHWYRFIKRYRSSSDSSYSLARWYRERLEGAPYLGALELERLQVISDYWEHGTSSISYQVAQCDDLFLRNQMVRGETLEIDEDSGKIGIATGEEFDSQRYEDALYNLNRRLKGLLRDGLGNALQALQGPILEFEEVFEEAKDSPSRMHDAASNLLFATKYLLDRGEISDSLQAQQLLRDAENSILEFRSADPVTDAKARELARLKYKEPDGEQLAALEFAAEESASVANQGIAKEITDDIAVVRGDLSASDDEKKVRGYRAAGRIQEMRNLGSQSTEKIGTRIKDSASKADQVNKLMKFGQNVSEVWPVIRDWLFAWFY